MALGKQEVKTNYDLKKESGSTLRALDQEGKELKVLSVGLL